MFICTFWSSNKGKKVDGEEKEEDDDDKEEKMEKHRNHFDLNDSSKPKQDKLRVLSSYVLLRQCFEL